MNRGYQRYGDGRSGMGQVHILPNRAAAVIGAAVVGVFRRGLARRRDRRTLAGLSDHMLRDIGVTRADIARTERQAPPVAGSARDWLPPVLGPDDWRLAAMSDRGAGWYFGRRR
jgi:uncharacterized protein YjiS (DUF1127 family)